MEKTESGFTLVELLVSSATLVVFIAAAAIIVQVGMKSLVEARLRGEAIRIAQEQLELARNLAYEEVGTVGGIPAGSLSAHVEKYMEGTKFNSVLSVLYVDDSFDQKAPNDLLPVDYKRVRVSVTWDGPYRSKTPVVLLTDVAPKNIETSPGTGSVFIRVYNSLGQAVSGAQVLIEAPNLTPAVNMEVITDANGEISIPGAPICNSCYRITVTKAGYTTDKTHGTDEVALPAKGHLSVLEGQITSASFGIDLPSTMVIRVTRSQESNYFPFVGAYMDLRGTKEIGRTENDDPVYKVNRGVVTSTNGLVTVTGLEWDSYSLSMPIGSSINFAGSWPFIPVALTPGNTTNISVVVEPMTPNSLLAQIVDVNRQPLPSATAELIGNGTVATKSAGIVNTGNWSQVFFNNLVAGNYELVIQAENYATSSTMINIAGTVQDFFIMATASAEVEP